jgi:tetratricopeptide (TPR) repeat protein
MNREEFLSRYVFSRFPILLNLVFYMRFLLACAALSVMLISACGSSKPTSSGNAGDKAVQDSLARTRGLTHFKDALTDVSKGNYAVALENYRRAAPFILTSDVYNAADRARYYNKLGECHFFMRNPDSALACFQLASTIDARNAESYNNTGYIRFVQRQYDDAIPLFKKSLSLKPDYKEARDNLQLAEEFKSGKLVWDAEGLFTRADSTKDLQEKVDMYRRIVSLLPNDLDAKNNLGVALFRAERHTEALNEFQKVIALDSNYAIAYNNMGFIYEINSEMDAAIRCYKNCLAKNPQYVLALENLAELYYANNKLSDARQTASDLLALDANNASAKSLLEAMSTKKPRKPSGKRRK